MSCSPTTCCVRHAAILWMLLLSWLVSSAPVRNGKCVYDLNLQRNTIKVSCGRGVKFKIAQDGSDVLPIDVFAVGNHALILSVNQIRNNSKELSLLEQNLSKQIKSLRNVTYLLSRGDRELKKDLKKLKMSSTNGDEASPQELLFAVIQNEYNYARAGLLTHNTEIERLANTVTSVVRLTTSVVDKMMSIWDEFITRSKDMNNTVSNLNKKLNDIERKLDFQLGSMKTSSHTCPQRISAIGQKPEWIHMGMTQGVVMRDPVNENHKIWVMYGYSSNDQIVEYETDIAFRYEIVKRTLQLPFYCEGTGHVVYNDALFCLKAKTNVLLKYDLSGSNWFLEKSLVGAGVSNTYPYDFGRMSDVDFAVDEEGLWVIYSTYQADGNIVISKVNPTDLTLERNWTTKFPKKLAGNTFMACGVLYATASFSATPTFIKYVFDTNTGKDKILEADDIPFSNNAEGKESSCVMLDYNPYDQKLYSWSEGRVEIYPIFFEAN